MKKTSVLLLFFMFLFSASCAINPVTGKREISLISEEKEIALGKETDAQIRIQYGVYDDSLLNEYVKKVGTTMIPHTHRPHLPYHFAVLDTPVVNAFAVPGGYVYVTRGILALMNSEAELAVVLGHELGHINARHSVRRISKMMLFQIGLGVGSVLSETFAKLSGAASVGIQLLFLQYSRDDERQADALGVEYSRKGSYNPGEMISFFQSLQKYGDLSGGGHRLPGFLSTHPLTAERIDNTKETLQAEDKTLTTGHNAYLNRINNIIFGNDPQQGYVEDNIFYHPAMRFFFSFPKDWTLQNSPTQVIIISKDENAAVILQAEQSSENLPDYANRKASEIEGRQFLSERHLTIHGMKSYQQLYDISQQNQATLRMSLSLIQKGPYIYSFTSLSTKEDFQKYDSHFDFTIGSFNELRDPAYINRQPLRLNLIKANGRESLQNIFRRSGLKKEMWPQFAILNGMEIEQVPQSGELIKIIK
jgi:predicted Zn-dependent protease